MTNYEKNKKRFDELGIGDFPVHEIAHEIAVRKNGDVDLCVRISCCDCIFKCGNCTKETEEWFLEEAEQDELVPEKKEEKMEKEEIKVGDTVKATTSRMREGKIGTVRIIHRAKNGKKFYYVRPDGESYGHVFFEHEIEKVKPEKKDEKMKKEEIKVGDTVKVTEDPVLKGKTGIVRRIYCTNNGKPYVVNFDENFCWTFSDHEIVKVKSKKTPPRIVVYRDGDTVTAKDLETGETASAVCSKDDTFDFYTGAFLAISRLTYFVDDIKMMRLETEQIEEDIADMKVRFGALMGEGYKCPEGFSRKEEE